MKRLSNSIADLYVKRKIIDPEDKEVYKSGVELILNDLVSFSIIIMFSCFVGHVRFSFEFLLTFCLTRIFCGGFHAKKAYVCKITMLTTFLLVMFGSYLMKNVHIYVVLSILLASFVIVFKLSPVKHPNKQLTEVKIIENHRKSVITFVLLAAVSMLVFTLANKQDGVIIALSLSAVAVLAIVGTLINGR